MMDTLPRDGLSQVEALAAISASTVVERRSDAVACVSRDATSATLHYPGATLRGPAQMEPVFRFVSEARRFSASALPLIGASYDKLGLIRGLIKDGVARVVEDGDDGGRVG